MERSFEHKCCGRVSVAGHKLGIFCVPSANTMAVVGREEVRSARVEEGVDKGRKEGASAVMREMRFFNSQGDCICKS